jgi:hypothetical protein
MVRRAYGIPLFDCKARNKNPIERRLVAAGLGLVGVDPMELETRGVEEAAESSGEGCDTRGTATCGARCGGRGGGVAVGWILWRWRDWMNDLC